MINSVQIVKSRECLDLNVFPSTPLTHSCGTIGVGEEKEDVHEAPDEGSGHYDLASVAPAPKHCDAELMGEKGKGKERVDGGNKGSTRERWRGRELGGMNV